jgi:hexokinase
MSLPSGREKGSYLAIDMGGTNLRVYNISLPGDDGELKVHQLEYPIPEELKDGEAESLWDHIASRLQDYLTDHHIEPKEGGTLPLTIIFSYPMTQHNIDEGILQRWTKGFNVDGVEGKNVTKQFKAALSKRVSTPSSYR